MWMSIIAAVISALVVSSAEFTTIFGVETTAKIMAALGLLNAVINGANAVLHMIPSGSTPKDLAQFPLGPTVVKP